MKRLLMLSALTWSCAIGAETRTGANAIVARANLAAY